MIIIILGFPSICDMKEGMVKNSANYSIIYWMPAMKVSAILGVKGILKQTNHRYSNLCEEKRLYKLSNTEA